MRSTLVEILALAVLVALPAAADTQYSVCESLSGAYRECRIGSSGTIRLVTEFSENLCYEGVTWGTSTPGVVWVTRGCRARFALQVPDVTPASGGKRVVCESLRVEHEVCRADTSKGADLVQQLGKPLCVLDETWGFDADHDQIWVDQGCRGIFVLGTRLGPLEPSEVLDTSIPCASNGRGRTTCPAYTGAGVQIVRQLSDDACHFGKDWGYDAKAIWVANNCRAEFAVRSGQKPTLSTVTCESEQGKKNRCAADTRFGVALVRKTSESSCILDQTWGFDADGVWVANGCGGQFALGGFRLPPAAVPATAARIVCESTDGKRTECAADASRGAGLIRQLGDALCVLNRTWGYGPGGIWVSGGCRAEFAVAH